MARWRIITVPLLMVLPFGVAGLLGARHTPSTLPPCLEATASVDFQRAPIDGVWFRQIKISNCGGGPVALDAISIDGPGHAAGFSLMGPTAGRIDVNAPMTLTVGFTPERVGSHAGALRIAAGESLLEVDLLGEGISPGRASVGDPACSAALPGGFVTHGACSAGGTSSRLVPAFEPHRPTGRPRAPSTPDASVADGQAPAT